MENATAIYYRVSTRKQDFEAQKTAVEAWLADKFPNKNRKSFRVYEDFGKSGKDTEKRDGFQRMMRDARQGKFTAVVVYRLDRLSRTAATAIQTVLELDKVGIEFFAVTQPVLCLGRDMPFSKTILAAFAEIAQIERETIVRRICDGLITARARGSRLGRPPSLTDADLRKICALADQRFSLKKIAEAVDSNVFTVRQVLLGQSVYGAEWARPWRENQEPPRPVFTRDRPASNWDSRLRRKPVVARIKRLTEEQLAAELAAGNLDEARPRRTDLKDSDEWAW